MGLLSVAMAVMVMVGSSPASAAASIFSWWQANVNAADDENAMWGYLDNSMQYWTVPATLFNRGYSYLELEVAGNANWNYFGWYTPTGSAPITRNQIFDGADTAGAATASPYLNMGGAGDTFGFYLDYVPAGSALEPGDAAYDPRFSFFTEDERNGDDDPRDADYRGLAGPANAWNTQGYRHVRVFDDPRRPGYGWIMAWEDLPAANTTTDEAQYANAWTDKTSLKWSEGGTADGPDWDYNDMIVAFHWVDRDGNDPTPELSTWLLLGLSLASVPVLRRRRRS